MDLAVLSVIIAALSLVVAVGSAVFARRSAQAAQAIRRKEEAAYGFRLMETRPSLEVRIDSVEYRWVIGNQFGSVEEVSDVGELTLDEIDSRQIEGEVCVHGSMQSGAADLLLSVHDHKSSGRSVWYPLQNQAVFRLEEGAIPANNQTAVSANSTRCFEWVDRRSVRQWAAIEAVQGRNFWDDVELQLPALPVRNILRHAHRLALTPWYYNYLQESLVPRSGFVLVAETRGEDRLAVVWTSEIIKTPFEHFGRNEKGRLTWRTRESYEGLVDDDRVFYRYHFDNALAHLTPPRVRHLPGRA